MDINKEISILQILKESLRDLKNKEILISTFTFLLVGTAISIHYNPFDSFAIKDHIFGVLGYFLILIGEMIIIKVVDKKCKKEEVHIKNIIKEVIPRSFSAVVLYLIVTILTLIGLIAVIIPGVIFSIYSAFYLQVFILENNGITNSINNSMSFSKGFRKFILELCIISLVTASPINYLSSSKLLECLFNSSIPSAINLIVAAFIDSFITISFTILYLKIKKIKTIE